MTGGESETRSAAARRHPADRSPEEEGLSPHSPEARAQRAQEAQQAEQVQPAPGRRRGLRGELARTYAQMKPGTRFFEVVKRVSVGVYYDGFIHAGNFAYMAMFSLFPFFITATAILSLFGQSRDGLQTLYAFFSTLPPNVAQVLDGPVREVLKARTGPLLWIGALFGLWTVGSLIETIRDILRRAYGTKAGRAFWEYRLTSIGLIVAAVVLLLFSFSLQVLMTALQRVIGYVLPQFTSVANTLLFSTLVPIAGLFLSLYLLFYSLTPGKYRWQCRKWPGALVTTLWWVAATQLLPLVLRNLADYDLTYGSLAGVMITLFFFYLVGLGMVIGAELNAALVETPEERDLIGQQDSRARRARAQAEKGQAT